MFIFLDIDGVLNKESDWSKPFSLNSDCIRRFCEKYREARIILSQVQICVYIHLPAMLVRLCCLYLQEI